LASRRTLGAWAALGCLLLAACSHDFTLENRETPVHVWLTAPDLARTGGRVDALVYVGAIKVVEGPVQFRPGVPTVALPTVFLNVGQVVVSAVIAGGSISATSRVEIEGESWVQIVVSGRGARILHSETQPSTTGR
jgi:hypothetical protein